MADKLGSIAILLEIVDKASPELAKFNKTLDSTSASMRQKFTAFGTAVAAVGTAVVGSIAAMTASAINFADEIGKTAQKVGMSTEDLSALAYAANLADVNLAELTVGIQQLDKAMIASQDTTSKQAQAFAYLGVKTKDVNGNLKDANTMFTEVAEAFSKMPDGVSKTTVAMDIFGKAGAKLIPLLNGGKVGLAEMRAEAERLGLILSENTTKAAEDFNDNMTRLKNASVGMSLAIAKELLPTLDTLVTSMIDAVKNGKDFKAFAEGIGDVFKFVVKVGAGVIFTFNAIGKGLGAIGAAVMFLLKGDFAAAKQVFADYKADVNESAVATAAFMQKIDDSKPIDNAVTGIKKLGKAYKDYKSDTGAEKTKRFDDLVIQIQREIAGVKDLTFAEQVRWDLNKGKYKDFDAAQKKVIENLLNEAAAAKFVNDTNVALKKSYEDILKAKTDIDASTQKQLADATTYLTILKDKGQAAADAWRTVASAIAPLEAQRAILQDLLDKAKAANDTQGVARYTAAITALNTEITNTSTALTPIVTQTATIVNDTKIWNDYIGKTRDEMKQLEQASANVTQWFIDGKITLDEYANALKRINDSKFNLLKKELTDMQKLTNQVASQMQSDFSTFFFDAMDGKIGNLAQTFKRMLDRMIADALAANLTSYLFGAANPQTGVRGGGAASNILQTGMNWLFGGMRENGGPVTAGVPYIVGEKRPEVFIPKTNGTIAPSVASAFGQGGSNMNVSFNITAMDSQDVMRSLEKIKRPLADLISGTNRAYNK